MTRKVRLKFAEFLREATTSILSITMVPLTSQLLFTGRTPIEVGSENVTGIQSIIKPGSELKGRVTITGTPPTPARGQAVQPITLKNMRVQLQPGKTFRLSRGEIKPASCS
jgi:hypothetical protein